MYTHHALSLNEMGAVPGGAFKTFWDPVYRMSISTDKNSHKHIYIWCHQNSDKVSGLISCPRETRNTYQDLILNLAGPCTEGLLPLMPQSRRETSSYTCWHES